MFFKKNKKFLISNQGLKKIFRSEESKFRLFTSIKIMLAPFMSLIFISFILWLFIRLDHIFFQANGLVGIKELEGAFYDYIFGDLSSILPYLGLFFIMLFFIGHYIGGLLLRPFQKIGDYCLKSLENEELILSYKRSELFCDFKTLADFSEFFFDWLVLSRKEKNLVKINIPNWFSKIHGPMFEKGYFYKFSVFLYSLCITSSVVLYSLTVEIYNQIIQLAIKTLHQNASINYFLQEQSSLFYLIIWISVFSLIISYTWLAIHLYGKVAGAAFAIFSTMRSFMKGNLSARVHLLGFHHIREFCRYLNKYLDYVEENYSVDQNQQKSLRKKRNS